jgi:acetyl esterase/lipase
LVNVSALPGDRAKQSAMRVEKASKVRFTLSIAAMLAAALFSAYLARDRLAFYYLSKIGYRWHYPLDNGSAAAIAADKRRGILRPTIADLPYADKSPFEKLDLYLPSDQRKPAPLVIWIHGGGFQVGDKRSMPRRDYGPPPKPLGPGGPFQIQVPDVAALTAKGYAVVSLNYRLIYKTGEHIYKAAIAGFQDGKSAVRFLRANSGKYNLDANKFAVWGNSAGGYMAAMLGVTGDQATMFDDPASPCAGTSSAVQAVVVWYGAVDADFLSPDIRMVHYIPTAKTLPPFLIANGEADPNVKASNARSLHEALVKAGANSTLTLIPGAGHEDPAFMATQMMPTFTFLDKALGQ